MDIYLVNSPKNSKTTQVWNLGDNGVLGLSKNSALWSYLQTFKHGDLQTMFLVGLSYHTDSNDLYNLDDTTLNQSFFDDYYKNSVLVINGKLNPSFPDVLMNATNSASDDLKNKWTFDTIELSGDETGKKYNLDADPKIFVNKGELVTLTNNGKFLFALTSEKYNQIKNFIAGKICPNEYLENCTKDNVDLKSAPELKLKVFGKDIDEEASTHTFSFESKDYLYFDKNNQINLAIKDVSDQEHQNVCGKTTTLCLGRILLTKLELVIKVDYATKNISVGFLENTYNFDDLKNFWTYFGAICAGSIFISLVFYIFFKITKNNYEKSMKEPLDWRRKEEIK